MENTQATVSGKLIAGIKKNVCNKGEEYYREFLSYLPETDRNLFNQDVILSVSRFPARLFRNLAEARIKLANGLDETAYIRSAAELARNDLSTTKKIFMRLGSPQIVAKKFPNIHRQYFNVGETVILSLTKKSLEIRLDDCEVYGESMCYGTIGWMIMALETAGAKEIQYSHPNCKFKTSTQCIFKFLWK